MYQERKQLGIYVHIPFCVKKCNYCDFTSAAYSQDIRQRYIDSLILELEGIDDKYSLSFDEYSVSTIYFGGGTPSVPDASLIIGVLDRIMERFEVDSTEHCEITIEVNPGTVDEDKLNAYRRAGFNRISIGLQSANEDELRLLGRIHSYNEFLRTYEMARRAGFANINVDVMTALPGQTLDKLKYTLCEVIRLNPEHISAYSLIIEEGTPFYDIYGHMEEGPVAEELEREMYHFVTKALSEHGYYRYEISNYSKPGYESRHNSSYWTGIDYLGLGLGASSLLDNVRYQNTSDMNEYLAASVAKCSIADEIRLTEHDQMEEYMFLALRMDRGASIEGFRQRFGISLRDKYGSVIDRLTSEGMLELSDDTIWLSDKGVDYGNYVFSSFLL